LTSNSIVPQPKTSPKPEIPRQPAASPATSRRAIVSGALLMIVATVCFVCLDSILKVLAGRHDVFFLAWGRNAFQLAFLVALMPFLGARRMIATRHPGIHVVRGALLVVMTVTIVFALRAMPLAQAYSISFSAPLIATILAAIFLNERPTLLRWVMIVAGFGGVLIALQPGAPDAGWHLVFPAIMALANALFHVVSRSIAQEDEPLAMIFLVALTATLISSLALPWTWSPMSAGDWGLLAIGGAIGTLAHIMLATAFRLAPTAIVSPMIYIQIVSASLVGYLAFGEVPTTATLLGAAIVVASGVVLIRSKG
jgi:drug/metabolite transporter (DMT)-like permease